MLHIAQTRPGLLPGKPNAGARAITWRFAALNTIKPVVLELENARFLGDDKPWYAERLPVIKGRKRGRLADLAMVGALMRLGSQGVLAEFPTLTAYVWRWPGRAACQRAFAAQLAVCQALQAGA